MLPPQQHFLQKGQSKVVPTGSPLVTDPAPCPCPLPGLGVGSCSAFAHLPTFSHLFRPTFTSFILLWIQQDVRPYPDSINHCAVSEMFLNFTALLSSHLFFFFFFFRVTPVAYGSSQARGQI